MMKMKIIKIANDEDEDDVYCYQFRFPMTKIAIDDEDYYKRRLGYRSG